LKLPRLINLQSIGDHKIGVCVGYNNNIRNQFGKKPIKEIAKKWVNE